MVLRSDAVTDSMCLPSPYLVTAVVSECFLGQQQLFPGLSNEHMLLIVQTTIEDACSCEHDLKSQR
jgi:hypothetical protein